MPRGHKNPPESVKLFLPALKPKYARMAIGASRGKLPVDYFGFGPRCCCVTMSLL